MEGQFCRTIQVLEPDPSLPVSSWRVDPAIDESGTVDLLLGQVSVDVTFVVPKTSSNYRFEYLYVDAFGVPNPGGISPVVVSQTQIGFTVKLAAAPPVPGYVLRWRVFIVDTTVIGGEVDTPESLRLQLPALVNFFTASFVNPRSDTNYGFSELRVENLIDPHNTQSPILAQVVQKTILGFSVGLSPSPRNSNYFLVARTP
jgi:hypothetical protein